MEQHSDIKKLHTSSGVARMESCCCSAAASLSLSASCTCGVRTAGLHECPHAKGNTFHTKPDAGQSPGNLCTLHQF
jgi:hypothetical protein